MFDKLIFQRAGYFCYAFSNIHTHEIKKNNLQHYIENKQPKKTAILYLKIALFFKPLKLYGFLVSQIQAHEYLHHLFYCFKTRTSEHQNRFIPHVQLSRCSLDFHLICASLPFLH